MPYLADFGPLDGGQIINFLRFKIFGALDEDQIINFLRFMTHPTMMIVKTQRRINLELKNTKTQVLKLSPG